MLEVGWEPNDSAFPRICLPSSETRWRVLCLGDIANLCKLW